MNFYQLLHDDGLQKYLIDGVQLRPKYIPTFEVPHWVPASVAKHFAQGISWGIFPNNFSAEITFRRLATDEKMKKVWASLKRAGASDDVLLGFAEVAIKATIRSFRINSPRRELWKRQRDALLNGSETIHRILQTSPWFLNKKDFTPAGQERHKLYSDALRNMKEMQSALGEAKYFDVTFRDGHFFDEVLRGEPFAAALQFRKRRSSTAARTYVVRVLSIYLRKSLRRSLNGTIALTINALLDDDQLTDKHVSELTKDIRTSSRQCQA